MSVRLMCALCDKPINTRGYDSYFRLQQHGNKGVHGGCLTFLKYMRAGRTHKEKMDSFSRELDYWYDFHANRRYKGRFKLEMPRCTDGL